MTAFIVVDDPDDWPVHIPGLEVVPAWRYLTDPAFTRPRLARIYNLCESYRYQSTGYYVSLLASARAHRPLPDVSTIQDMKVRDVPRYISDEIDVLIGKSLAPIESSHFTLSIYFGQNLAQRHARLSRALFNWFPAPLLRARFEWSGTEWQLRSFSPIPLGEVPESHRPFLYEAAAAHFSHRQRPRRRATHGRFDLAILCDPEEAEPPSNARALKHFTRAAENLGFSVERITKADYGRVAEFDALFIRETTAVNHHTYRMARRAERAGVVVMDDPESIVRCTNKVYLAQLLERHHIATPPTLMLHRTNIDQAIGGLGFPCVLKQPDSAFSKGVIKVDTADELRQEARRMLERSDLIVAQAFVPTEYDWRIGVLDGEPLYACRYYMARKHWQIIKRDGRGRKTEGLAETLAVDDVPRPVLNLAVRAARAIGRGLYGVDLKQFGVECRIIEINDNPNIDAGIEDEILGDALYRRIMEYFFRRLQARIALDPDSNHGAGPYAKTTPDAHLHARQHEQTGLV